MNLLISPAPPNILQIPVLRSTVQLGCSTRPSSPWGLAALGEVTGTPSGWQLCHLLAISSSPCSPGQGHTAYLPSRGPTCLPQPHVSTSKPSLRTFQPFGCCCQPHFVSLIPSRLSSCSFLFPPGSPPKPRLFIFCQCCLLATRRPHSSTKLPDFRSKKWFSKGREQKAGSNLRLTGENLRTKGSGKHEEPW